MIDLINVLDTDKKGNYKKYQYTNNIYIKLVNFFQPAIDILPRYKYNYGILS